MMSIGDLARSDERRLRFVRHAREIGFDITVVKKLLALQGAPNQQYA